MDFIETGIKDLLLIKPKVFMDERGFFMESFSEREFKRAGINICFRQDNHSMSAKKGVLRGLHLQLPPYTQTKLVRVTRGSVFDVAVDLRKNSPTYGKWRGFELSADNHTMLFIPHGFAHGFCSLEEDTEFMYKNDNFYEKDSEVAIRWDDPDINIDWPIKDVTLSDKDINAIKFRDFKSPF